MKEIEVKAKLRDKDKVVEKLKSLGCLFEESVNQDDVVYAKNIGSLQNFRTNDVFLRLRVKNRSKIIFTLKMRGKNDLDSIEHETEISSKDEMSKVIKLMGYKEAVMIRKNRIITNYEGCEICIDEVEGLGSFIEMEKLSEEGDSEKIQEELFKFLISLGIDSEDRVKSGYDILTLQKLEKN